MSKDISKFTLTVSGEAHRALLEEVTDKVEFSSRELHRSILLNSIDDRKAQSPFNDRTTRRVLKDLQNEGFIRTLESSEES